MRTRTAIEASRDLLACQHALDRLDEAARQMRTVYAGEVPHEVAVDFGAHYVQWLAHRWFAEQWLAQQRAANESTVSPLSADGIAGAGFVLGPHPAGDFFTPAAARHPHADDTHRPPVPTPWQPACSTEQ